MSSHSILRKAVLTALYGAGALSALPVAAQTQAASGDMTVVNVVGSRRATSSLTDTVAPVDVISLTKASEQGAQFDLAQTLTFISPSFNSTRQTGADGADLVDSAALRGLSSDQTLVLVNGKRRHTSSLVNIFGARNRGATGTDMNAIPVMAIKDVQVLRDGAAAQYGSALERLARGYEGDPDRRRDLLQEIHIVLWRSFDRFDGRCSLRTWVYRVAHNAATSLVLRRRVRSWPAQGGPGRDGAD